jgi:hypothetical protein
MFVVSVLTVGGTAVCKLLGESTEAIRTRQVSIAYDTERSIVR